VTVGEIVGVALGGVIILATLWNMRGHRRSGDETFTDSESGWQPVDPD
jgi:hypothetical protein